MKKNLLLLSFFVLSSNFSCNTKSNNTSTLEIKRKDNIDGLIKLETTKQVTDIFDYEDMIVLVTQPTCKWCHTLYPLIDQFIKETNSIIYEVEFSIYYQLDKSTFMVDKITGTPTFVFIDNQKIVNIEGAASYTDYSALYNQITTQSKLTNYYCLNDFNKNERSYIVSGKEINSTFYTLSINEDTDALSYSSTLLEEKIKNNNITILYTWRRCNDCKELKLIIDEYLKENLDKKIYYYEVDGFMQGKRDENDNIKKEAIVSWENFNKTFSFKYYPSFAYNELTSTTTSVTPTLINYPSTINFVYSNDSNITENEDKTLSYKESYNTNVLTVKTDNKLSDDKSNYESLLNELNEKVKTVEKDNLLNFLNNYN